MNTTNKVLSNQERRSEICSAIKEQFPNAHVREYSFGFRVFLVPLNCCANRIQENCPVSFSVDFVNETNKLQIKTALHVLPKNKMYFCDNAAKKHKLNVTIQEGKPFAPFLLKLKKALAEENMNIIGNEDGQLTMFFI